MKELFPNVWQAKDARLKELPGPCPQTEDWADPQKHCGDCSFGREPPQ